MSATTGFVYFAETSDGQFVKIGFSSHPHRRVRSLGTLRPGPLFEAKLLGCIPGSVAAEKWLHQKLQQHRDNGEWFKAVRPVREFIDALITGATRLPADLGSCNPPSDDDLAEWPLAGFEHIPSRLRVAPKRQIAPLDATFTDLRRRRWRIAKRYEKKLHRDKEWLELGKLMATVKKYQPENEGITVKEALQKEGIL